jgi:hypothetical protein
MAKPLMDRIVQAREAALTDEASYPVDGSTVEDCSLYLDLKDVADDYVVSGSYGPLGPSAIEVTTLQGLADLNVGICRAAQQFGWYDWIDTADSTVRHEAAHGLAYPTFGVVPTYSIEAFRNPSSYGPEVIWSAATGSKDHFSISRLGLAVIFAMPEIPSEADLDYISALGYDGVQDVGRRAVMANLRVGEYVYPIPFSYHHSS